MGIRGVRNWQMELESKVYEIDQVPKRELDGKYCLLPYVRLFAECDDSLEEMIVKVVMNTQDER